MLNSTLLLCLSTMRWVKLGKEVESLRRENRSLSVSVNSLIARLERLVFDENVNATEEWSVENGLPFPIQVEAHIHLSDIPPPSSRPLSAWQNKFHTSNTPEHAEFNAIVVPLCQVRCPTVKLLPDPLELVVLITEFARLCLVLILRIFLLDL
ncbi:hypothetical protein LguiA_007362 [Lonicera macranthoides]